MDLPRADSSVVPETKIVGYLLSLTHPRGQHKAAYFASFGFSANDWQVLQSALLAHAQGHEVESAQRTLFRMRYPIRGALSAPDGRAPMVRTVWFVEEGQAVPRFVTAYPVEGTRE